MDDDLTVRISSLEHYLYCPRQCGLIEVEGQWADNEHTVRGRREHQRAGSGAHRRERGRLVLRSIPLWSQRWGLVGRADVVEMTERSLTPVEYKSGVRHGRSAEVQLCAQALCLEDMFAVHVDVGFVWYGASRRRATVAIDPDLRAQTVRAIAAVRDLLRGGQVPGPSADQRCEQCQLEPRCLPYPTSRPGRAARLLDDLLQER